MAKVKKPESSPIILVKYSKDGPSHLMTETVVNVTHKRDEKIISLLQNELDKLSYKFNAIFNKEDLGYIILNKKMKIVDFNDAFGGFLGVVTEKKLKVGELVNTYIFGEFANDVTDNFNRALKGETLIIEREVKYSKGESIWWMVEYAPAYSAAKKINGVVLRVRDITEQKSNALVTDF